MAMPMEIRQQICGYLNRPDLKNVRLVSKDVSDASIRLLFGQVYLKPNMDSFMKIQLIAAHPDYRTLVKALTYCIKILSHDVEGSPSREQLRDYYERIHNEKLLMKWGLEKIYLVNALQGLSNINQIAFCIDNPSSRCSSASTFPMSGIDRPTLLEPQDYTGCDCHAYHFRALVHALSMGKSLEPFRCFGLPSEASPDPDAIIQTMSGCHNFLLHLDYPDDDIGSRAVIVSQMIAGAPYLRTLNISFEYLSHNAPEANINLSQLIELRCYWPNLKRLALQAIYCTNEALRAFLTSHASTLRTLKLAYIDLVQNPATPNDYTGSWVSKMLFLEQTLSLEEVQLNGNYSNSRDEAWPIHDPSDANYWWCMGTPKGKIPPVGSCLKHRIEQFLVEGGNFPLPVPKARMPWQYLSFPGDDSWSFDYRSLESDSSPQG